MKKTFCDICGDEVPSGGTGCTVLVVQHELADGTRVLAKIYASNTIAFTDGDFCAPCIKTVVARGLEV